MIYLLRPTFISEGFWVAALYQYQKKSRYFQIGKQKKTFTKSIFWVCYLHKVYHLEMLFLDILDLFCLVIFPPKWASWKIL